MLWLSEDVLKYAQSVGVMKGARPVHDCVYAFGQGMTYDLGDAIRWEYLLCGSTGHSLLLIPDMRNELELEEEDEVSVSVYTLSLSLSLSSLFSHSVCYYQNKSGLRLSDRTIKVYDKVHAC